MSKYVKKPVEVEAIKYLREVNIAEVQEFVGDKLGYNADKNEYFITTIEGNMLCTKGDYIIKGVNGEFYPCKPDIFEKTYNKSKKTYTNEGYLTRVLDIIRKHTDMFEEIKIDNLVYNAIRIDVYNIRLMEIFKKEYNQVDRVKMHGKYEGVNLIKNNDILTIADGELFIYDHCNERYLNVTPLEHLEKNTSISFYVKLKDGEILNCIGEKDFVHSLGAQMNTPIHNLAFTDGLGNYHNIPMNQIRYLKSYTGSQFNIDLLKSGTCLKRKHWGGYWKYDKEKDTIFMHCKDGLVIDIKDTEDLGYTINNILATDWEIATENNISIVEKGLDLNKLMSKYKNNK